LIKAALEPFGTVKWVEVLLLNLLSEYLVWKILIYHASQIFHELLADPHQILYRVIALYNDELKCITIDIADVGA
jgi:hypothetical protein